jgi:hypothetical protein
MRKFVEYERGMAPYAQLGGGGNLRLLPVVLIKKIAGSYVFSCAQSGKKDFPYAHLGLSE